MIMLVVAVQFAHNGESSPELALRYERQKQSFFLSVADCFAKQI